MKIQVVLLLFLIFSCQNPNKRAEQQIDNVAETSKQFMDDDIQKLRQNFILSYNNKLKESTDSFAKQRLHELYSSIVDADEYLDSMKNEMNKLDVIDVNNVELVKTIFLYKSVGDSIIKKLKGSIAAAQTVAKTNEQKSAIQVASNSLFGEPDTNKWKEQLFSSTNPLGAYMILYGFQTQLYNISIGAL